MKKNFKFLVTLLLLMIIYFFGVRSMLGSAIAAQVELIVLGGLTLVFLGAVLFLAVMLLVLIFSKNSNTLVGTLARSNDFHIVGFRFACHYCRGFPMDGLHNSDSGRERSAASKQYCFP